MSQDMPHQPVMLDEIVEVLRPVPPGLVVDATVGAAGHARALLEARDDLALIGLDADADALAEAGPVLARFGDRVELHHARFDAMASTLRDSGHRSVSAVLFDLGVSSMQLDRGERGFSYRSDFALDMRMDQRLGVSADDIVNGYSVERLAGVLADHGGERFALRVARAIDRARPVHTTADLAEIVREAIPAATRRRGGHPAKRTFQALRIEVNQELAVLPDALAQALELLVTGGRCAVLSYHSGEDRIVKARFADAASGGCRCPVNLPCGCGARPQVRLLWRGARRPTPAEVDSNRRSSSARLRAVEKIALEGDGR